MPTVVCRDCGEEFDPRKKSYRGGFYNQCGPCARLTGDADIKYLGKPGLTNKDASIEIFRSDLESVRAVIRRENRMGITANLNISNAAQERVKEQFKTGQEPDMFGTHPKHKEDKT